MNEMKIYNLLSILEDAEHLCETTMDCLKCPYSVSTKNSLASCIPFEITGILPLNYNCDKATKVIGGTYDKKTAALPKADRTL